MSQPYVGEIRMFGGNFAPAGWMFCEGQLLPISENETLFNLIGTTYGGDGQETFALPDLRGRLPIHQGQQLHFGAEWGRRGGNADGATDPDSQPSCARLDESRERHSAEGQRHGPERISPDLPCEEPRCREYGMLNAIGSTGGSQPHDKLPAVSVHRLHHFTLRNFPNTVLRN